MSHIKKKTKTICAIAILLISQSVLKASDCDYDATIFMDDSASEYYRYESDEPRPSDYENRIIEDHSDSVLDGIFMDLSTIALPERIVFPQREKAYSEIELLEPSA